MLSNKKIRYEDDWDTFIRKIRRFSPKQRKALMEEGQYAGNLTMIVALSAHYLHAYSTNDARKRLHNQMLRIQEQRRLTPNPDAIRNYVDESTKAMMPTIIVSKTTPQERTAHTNSARTFWKGIARGKWRGRNVDQIVARERSISRRARLLAKPYGPRVSDEDINTLRAALRAARPASKAPRTQIAPAGMSPERALQIAMQSLQRGK